MTASAEPRTLREESRRLGGFRVPVFKVRIAGSDLPDEVLRDVTQVTYRDNIRELDSFQMTVNNWDPAARDFKYVGAETADDLEAETAEGRRFRLLEPCGDEVRIEIGYLEDVRLMMRGKITAMDPVFSSGPPTLTIRGLNVLHELRTRPHTDAWTDERDSDIARAIAERSGREFEPFPLPIRISEEARSAEERIDYVTQKNQHDIDFLLQRARLRGYVVYVRETDEGERYLYFGPSEEDTTPRPSYALEWGRSLTDFKPTLSIADRVHAITVEGWNRRTNSRISEEITLDDDRLRVNRDLYRLLDRCETREEIVDDKPVHSPAEARDLALALMRDQLKELIQANASTVGLPDLRAGTELHIGGVGSRFGGRYFVTETTHTINDQGYTTRFKARREQLSGGDDA